MHKSIMSIAFLFFAGLLLPSTASAGPLACAQAIGGCVGGGTKVAKKIKASRNACAALRDCKKVCRVDKRDAKGDARNDKKSCLNKCDGKKGKAKRQCKSACRKDKRGDFKEARGDKRACVQQCRDDYKTPACKKARRQMIATIVAQGLKCAAQVTAQCATPTP
ncbi:MAG: hypothetical protein ACE366_17375 [Bradymonadia bacterium]